MNEKDISIVDVVLQTIEDGLRSKKKTVSVVERFNFKEKKEYQERLIQLRSKVKDADISRKRAMNNYKKALFIYGAKDEDVVLWDEEKRNEVTKHRRFNRIKWEGVWNSIGQLIYLENQRFL